MWHCQLIKDSFQFDSSHGVCIVDQEGLLFDDSNKLSIMQKSLARPFYERPSGKSTLSLIEAIEYYQPDVLIGVTGVAGLFTEEIIKALAKHTQTPIIMPLSNPISACEVTPQQVYDWIGNDVIVTTGSPFAPVQYDNQSYTISQCNNVYVFPGIGLGAKVASAKSVSNGMLLKAVDALATFECTRCSDNEVLPAIESTLDVSKSIAIAVAKQAMKEGLSDVMRLSDDADITAMIEHAFWNPEVDKASR
ncbi:malic enzyme-like NAD(P)-binding protein [Photobacterium sanguinicancri]|uniref:malic enzyme-like NAD(P)-binding protein n=1 Tax=Photobacterium sanguinicancri TaxID=875932 RepID=UPI000788D3E0|nr:malic enzyme-like NAD(P)-binding protein [Photobacterium sanguinicancri]KXI24403.1 hypothetical protein AS132_01975 [Photobacterium sanguinicancri]